MHIGERLRLDPLARINDKDGAVAGLQASRDLVGEVNVARGVDQIEAVGEAIVRYIVEAHGARLDRDPLLALKVHRVEHL